MKREPLIAFERAPFEALSNFLPVDKKTPPFKTPMTRAPELGIFGSVMVVFMNVPLGRSMIDCRNVMFSGSY